MRITLFVLVLLLASGCSTAPKKKPPMTPTERIDWTLDQLERLFQKGERDVETEVL